MDILQHAETIRQVLTSLKVPYKQWEDLTQECYVALIEKEGRRQTPYQICRTAVIDAWRREVLPRRRHKSQMKEHSLKLLSLSLPAVMHESEKVKMCEEDNDLKYAIMSLPDEESQVIHSVYVEDKTQAETAKDLGLTRRRVRTLLGRGIKNLKKYYEVIE